MITIITAIIAGVFSSGMFQLIIFLIQRHDSKNGKKSAESDMLLGLGHDRIVFLGEQYIQRGFISRDEYENLHDYLYKPYQKLGGNGTAERIMDEVGKLPLKEGTYGKKK